MSLEVKKVAGYEQTQQTTAVNSAQKAQQEKEKLNNEIQQALLGNTKAQESRKTALAEQYTKELDMTNAEAKKAAQTRVDDEVAEERISGTDVYYNKSEYEKLINSVTESDIIDVANRIFNNCYIKVTVD